MPSDAAAAAAGGLSTDAGYADGKPELRLRSSSAAPVIQTFRGHANLGPDECGTLVMDAGR